MIHVLIIVGLLNLAAIALFLQYAHKRNQKGN
jgi:hypothetical protein